MSVLNEIGKKYGTDKASDGKRGEVGLGHDYLRVYETILKPRRAGIKKVLEIGVQRGSSVKTWAEYFSKADIYGIDIHETALSAAGDRIHIELVDQGDQAAMTAFAEKYGPFDFIIEDGSHFWWHQIANIQWMIPHVKPGGLYIVEDLHTSYSKSGEHGTPGDLTAVKYVQKCIDQVISGGRHKEPDMQMIHDRVETIMTMRRAACFFLRETPLSE